MTHTTQNKEIRKLAAVMFTDIKGYTAMVQKDEELALSKVEQHRNALTQATSANNGQVVQFYGDGSLSIYESALDAVKCAVEMQKNYRENKVPVRIGIHLGDIVIKNDTIYGDGVNVSSRIESQGIPGAIVVSKKIQQELINHPAYPTRSVGFFDLKNVQEKEEIFVIDHADVYVPSAKEFKSRKKISLLKKVLIPLLLISIFLAIMVVKNGSFQKSSAISNIPEDLINQRIGVQLFQNLTMADSLDILSNMAAHWITKGLSETNAQVVSYQTITQNSGKSGDLLQRAIGAENVITGTVFLQSDSLIFSANISNVSSGIIAHTFPEATASISSPLKGISELANSIKGYWTSRDDNLLSPPKYDAYKAFITAKDNWIENDERAMEFLSRSIELDSTFLDPYFLLLDLYSYQSQSNAATQLLNNLGQRFPEMSDRQKNILNYHKADIDGNNQQAYDLYLNEYRNDPKDLFVNNTMMVLAQVYVNNAEKAIDFFEEIPFDDLSYANCEYCKDRLYGGVLAYAKVNSQKDISTILNTLEETATTRRALLGLIKYYCVKKNLQKVDETIQRAFDLNVNNPGYTYFIAAQEFQLQGDTDLQVAYGKKALAFYEGIPSRSLARTLYLLGELDKANKTYEKLLSSDPEDVRNISKYGIIQALKGDLQSANDQISYLETLKQPFDYGLVPYYQAKIYLALGNEQKAIELLKESIDQGFKHEQFLTFENDPDLLPLNGNPKYKQLIIPKL